MTEEPGGLRPMGSERDTAERLSTQIDGEKDDGRMWLIQGLSWMVVGQDVKRDLPSGLLSPVCVVASYPSSSGSPFIPLRWI